jgi:hypothetical protein
MMIFVALHSHFKLFRGLQLLCFVAILSAAHFAPAAPTISLAGAVNNQVLTNPASLLLTASCNNTTGSDNDLYIYDGNVMLFRRPFNVQPFSMTNLWVDPPVGVHALRCVLVQSDFSTSTTNQTTPITVTVLGALLGFSAVTNLVTIPTVPMTGSNTTIGVQLTVRNQTPVPSNPLRVRFFTTQTYFYQTRETPPSNPTFTEYVQGPIFTNASLASNATASFTLTTNQNVLCPGGYKSFGNNGETGAQFHVYAVLEEKVGTNWANVDRTKIFSSVPLEMFPYDDGALGIEPLLNTNSFAYLTNLLIAGVTNINEGTTAGYAAVAALSDGTTGTVSSAWSAMPFAIGPDGLLNAPFVGSDTSMTITTTFTRRTTRTAVRTVTIKNLGDPPLITSPPVNRTVGIGSNATFAVTATGTAPLKYQWRLNGTNFGNATNSLFTVSNAQPANAGPCTVVITNVAGAVTSAPVMLAVVSRPQFGTPQLLPNHTFKFAISGTPGSICVIEFSTNLTSWFRLTNLTLTGSSLLFTNTSASNATRRFYKARID